MSLLLVLGLLAPAHALPGGTDHCYRGLVSVDKPAGARGGLQKVTAFLFFSNSDDVASAYGFYKKNKKYLIDLDCEFAEGSSEGKCQLSDDGGSIQAVKGEKSVTIKADGFLGLTPDGNGEMRIAVVSGKSILPVKYELQKVDRVQCEAIFPYIKPQNRAQSTPARQ